MCVHHANAYPKAAGTLCVRKGLSLSTGELIGDNSVKPFSERVTALWTEHPTESNKPLPALLAIPHAAAPA